MRKQITIAAILLLSSLTGVYAQEKSAIRKDADKVGNKTAEIASKAMSTVVDKEYKDKVGPDGQTIYINGHSKYYWIDKKGHKKFVSKMQLKDKK